jgi:hypothetical protein
MFVLLLMGVSSLIRNTSSLKIRHCSFFTVNGDKKTGWSTTDAYDSTLKYKVKDKVPRWKFELAGFVGLVAWFVVFQVSFFVTLVIPLVARRVISGHNSEYVP